MKNERRYRVERVDGIPLYLIPCMLDVELLGGLRSAECMLHETCFVLFG